MRRDLVTAGSAADGTALRDLDLGEDVWVSIVTRAGKLVPVDGDTVLLAGDEVLMFGEPDATRSAASLFSPS